MDENTVKYLFEISRIKLNFLKYQVLKLNLYQISGEKKNAQFTRNKKIKNSKD